MNKKQYLNLLYNNKNYSVNIDKLLKLLSILEGCEILDASESELINLVKKYHLFDEVFLENINYL